MENLSSVINTNTNNEKLDIKKVFICGGTGFLGFYSAKSF